MSDTYQVTGSAAIAQALDAGVVLRLVLVRDDSRTSIAALLARVESAGVVVREATPRVIARLANGAPNVDALGLVGRDPAADLDGVLAAGGASWLLVGVAYPGNVGMVIRTAEVSGATGILVNAKFDGEGRKAALRASMRADKFMPVFWEGTEALLDGAVAAGHKIVAIDESGTESPWDVDLCGPRVFVVGGENGGIPREVLDRAHHVVRVPMAGFIPCYNLQAAVSAIATERLRQRSVAGEPVR